MRLRLLLTRDLYCNLCPYRLSRLTVSVASNKANFHSNNDRYPTMHHIPKLCESHAQSQRRWRHGGLARWHCSDKDRHFPRVRCCVFLDNRVLRDVGVVRMSELFSTPHLSVFLVESSRAVGELDLLLQVRVGQLGL